VIKASCHCGAISLELPRKPRTVTDCNCSLCRRYSGLWAFYATKDVRIKAYAGSISSYVWGNRSIRHVRCRRCGCVTHRSVPVSLVAKTIFSVSSIETATKALTEHAARFTNSHIVDGIRFQITEQPRCYASNCVSYYI
jgi:hypothetical protein